MGSSAKRKKEKQKDFQKTKLKVGKSKPKAANFTDTSFKAKSITLQKQSLSTSAPSATSKFSHHVSLLRNRADAQRSESLAYLTTAIANTPPGDALPEPVALLLPKLQPLIVDGSSAVRQQLLKLLRSLPAQDVARQPETLLLYTHVAMTHLSADIKAFAMDVLGWLLEVAGHEIVSCAGGWVKTLRCFVRLLGWLQATGSDKWSTYQSSGVRPGTEAKTVSKQLYALASFISAGIALPSREAVKSAEAVAISAFPYRHLQQHLLPERSNAFGGLHLFGPPPNEEEGIYEDREDRQRLYAQLFRESIQPGLDAIKGEGGEIGRASAAVRKAIEEGMSDYAEFNQI